MREQLVALSNLFVIQIAGLLEKKKKMSCVFLERRMMLVFEMPFRLLFFQFF